MPTRGGGGGDPNQPTQRAMHFIKNKNNITDMKLKLQLAEFEREKSVCMYNIDHDRLDVKDFLREVRHCASDELPESKLWLGEKEELKKKRERKEGRNASTAPGGATKDGAQRDIKTAPENASGGQEGDMVQFGIFLKKRKDLDPNKVHHDIYSRRNMYSSIERDVKTKEQQEEEDRMKEEQRKKWQEEQEQKAREEAEQKERERKEEEARLKKEKDEERQRKLEAHRAAMLAAEKDSTDTPRIDIKAEMRRIACVREPTDFEKREARIRNMNANAELMKDILMKNAKKRAQSKKKRLVPLEDRIRLFLTKVDTLRKKEDDDDAAEPTKEQKRRYILMTKGVKAALEFTAENDEENDLHTF